MAHVLGVATRQISDPMPRFIHMKTDDETRKAIRSHIWPLS